MGARDESLANVYANALLELAFEKGVHGEVLAELRAFREILTAMPTFAAFLGTPNVRQDAKKGWCSECSGARSPTSRSTSC